MHKFKKVGITFDTHFLNELKNDPNSCVVVKKLQHHIGLHPYHLNDLTTSVTDTLSRGITKYSTSLGGVLLGFRNIKFFNDLGSVNYDNCSVHIDIEADFYLFRPEVGRELNGIVTKKTNDHVSCLLYNVFNISLPKPEDGENWLGRRIKIGQEVQFRITFTDLTYRFPYIRGEIVKVLTKLGNGLDFMEDEDEEQPKKSKKKKKQKEVESSANVEEETTSKKSNKKKKGELVEESPKIEVVESTSSKSHKNKREWPKESPDKQVEESPSKKSKKKKKEVVEESPETDVEEDTYRKSKQKNRVLLEESLEREMEESTSRKSHKKKREWPKESPDKQVEESLSKKSKKKKKVVEESPERDVEKDNSRKSKQKNRVLPEESFEREIEESTSRKSKKNKKNKVIEESPEKDQESTSKKRKRKISMEIEETPKFKKSRLELFSEDRTLDTSLNSCEESHISDLQISHKKKKKKIK